jgi:hypothetical protein
MARREIPYKKIARKRLSSSSVTRELDRTSPKHNHQYFPGGSSGGDGEGLWDISNDAPDPFEGRLEDYEISVHS